MKIEIVKYDKYNEFEIKIDGITFTPDTKIGGYISYAAITSHILKEKYNAKLVLGYGTLLSSAMHIYYKGKSYNVVLGKNSHSPDNAKHFMNVIKSHVKHLDEAIAEIDKMPIYTCKNCKSKRCPIFKTEAFEQANFGVSGDLINSTIFAVVDIVGCKFEEAK